ncbi:MAG: 4-diphosphocytidyl-2C-methyl-D-erythritol synthase [Rhodospirillaceae bacterium]|nr:4-diphosphocytidyl-2C-methyl-D-erythritol synthase [Rhodospirillaceae bacterium]
MSGFTALVLAGSRRTSGEGLNTANQLKAAMPLAGAAMINRVIAALSSSKHIARIVVCGPPELGAWTNVEFFPPAASPARSTLAFFENHDGNAPLLVTTADHALLTTEMVDHFCQHSLDQGGDLTVAMADKAKVLAAHAGTRRTGYPFRDGAWCSCNMFGMLTPKVAKLIAFWRYVEENRKKPWKVISAFGWLSLLGVILRVWTLRGAFRRGGARFGVAVSPVIMPWTDAAIDVDTLGDKALAESILSARLLPTA